VLPGSGDVLAAGAGLACVVAGLLLVLLLLLLIVRTETRTDAS
jgi:uncharacterized integral membrane protein